MIRGEKKPTAKNPHILAMKAVKAANFCKPAKITRKINHKKSNDFNAFTAKSTLVIVYIPRFFYINFL